MKKLLCSDESAADQAAHQPVAKSRLGQVLASPWTIAVLALLVGLAGLTTRWYHLDKYPFVDSDEGTYVAQATAWMTRGVVSYIGYWFDHSPSWILISYWLGGTDALDRRNGLTALAGRECMAVMALLTAALLLVLAWRLGYRLMLALLASALWILSPLSVTLTRQCFLDNLVWPFLLGSMLLVLTRRQRLWRVTVGALCFAAACLAKEVAFLAGPGLVYMVWDAFDGSPRRWRATLQFVWVAFAGWLVYPLLAWWNGRLGDWWHGQIAWQLADRVTSGSIFDPQSQAYDVVHVMWGTLDWWLPLAGVLAVVPAFFVRRLRGLAIIQLAFIVVLLAPSRYLPKPFAIELLPVGALLVAGLFDAWWPSRAELRGTASRRMPPSAGIALVLGVSAVFVLTGGPKSWYDTYQFASTTDNTLTQRQAVAWMQQNLHPDDVIVVDTEYWLDAVRAGVPVEHAILPNSLDNAPELVAKAGGIDAVTYIIVDSYTLGQNGDSASYPTLYALATRSDVVAMFGAPDDWRMVEVLRVRRDSGSSG